MALLSYTIDIQGIQNAESAFQSLEKRAAALNARVAQSAAKAGRASSASGGMGHAQAAADRRRESSSEREDVGASVKAVVTGERAKAAAARQASKERIQAEREVAAAAKQSLREMREASRAKVALERENTRVNRQEAAKQAFEARSADRAARQQRALEAAGRRDARVAEGVGTKRYNRLAGIAGGTASTLSGLGTGALAFAGIGGGAMFATAIHDQIEVVATASKLANQFSTNGATPEEVSRNKARLLRESGNVQGFSRQETLEAMSLYHEKTGEEGSARRLVNPIARLSLATSSDIRDVSSFGSTIHENLKTAGYSNEDAEKIVIDVLKNAAMQAKEKSVELKNFAAVGSNVVSQSAFLTGDKPQAMKLGMAITQMAKSSSAEEKATSYQNMVGDLVKHQDVLKKMGVKDSIKGGKLDLVGTLGQVLEKSGGNVEKAMKVFNIRGLRAFIGLQELFESGEKKKKGTGRATVENELNRLVAATMGESAIDTNVKSRMSDPDIQIKEAWKRLNTAIGQELVPVITKMIPSIAEAAPALGRFASAVAGMAEWLMKNPWEGLGGLVAAVVTKEIASAALGEAIKSTLVRILSGATGGVVGNAVSGAAGAAGTTGTVGTAGVAGAAGTAGAGIGIAGVAGAGVAIAGAAMTYGIANDTSKAIQEAKDMEAAAKDPGALMKVLSGNGDRQTKLSAIDAAEKNAEEVAAAKRKAVMKTSAMVLLQSGPGMMGAAPIGAGMTDAAPKAETPEEVEKRQAYYRELRAKVIYEGGTAIPFNELPKVEEKSYRWEDLPNADGSPRSQNNGQVANEAAEKQKEAAEKQTNAAGKLESAADKLGSVIDAAMATISASGGIAGRPMKPGPRG